MAIQYRLSTDGKDTKERLIRSAVSLFSRKWYGIVSVAEICRESGLSNGVFYRYFTGKEELFRSILEVTQDMIADTIAGIEARSRDERVAGFVEVITRFSAEHPDLIAVFREGQYRFIEYERKLEEIYTRGLSRAMGLEIGMPENIFALGGIRFCAIRSALQGVKLDEASVHAIVRGGLFPGLTASTEGVFAGPVNPLPLEIAEGSRACLLQAGKRHFGEKGFFETNIHEITDAAGLSVGAFYTHFESKTAFYAELIKRAGHDLRRFISTNLPAGLNRLEREMRGLWLFALYLQSDKDCYNIVREAEFVLSSEVRAYYGAFVEGYRKRPLSGDGLAEGLDEATAIEFLLGVNHYFGIESAFTDSPGNIKAKVEAIGTYLSRGFSALLKE
jgi:AcrR family transcriptional regulator